MKKYLFLLIITILFSYLTVSYSQTGWFQQNSTSSEWLRSVSFANSSTGWTVGNAGTILKTTNGGSNWFQQVSGTSQGLWAVNFFNTGTGWACGFSGVLLKTTNGGLNWFQLNSSTTVNLRFFSIYDV